MSTVTTTSPPAVRRTTHYVDRWIFVGLLALPAYGLLTFASSLHPQPDPTQDYAAWARFVTTTRYLVGHTAGTGLGLILAVFGLTALGAFLTRGRSGRLGVAAAVISMFANMAFLSILGASAFAAPATARAYLAGVTNIQELQQDPVADLVVLGIFLLVIVANVVGNVLLGVAIWRSGLFPRAAGLIWILSAIGLYVLGLVVSLLFTNASTPTEPIGGLLVALAGLWMAWSAQRSLSLQRRS
jgi:hypothetical protein